MKRTGNTPENSAAQPSPGTPNAALPLIYQQTIRPTPMAPVRLDGKGPEIGCKLEYLIPSGSTKDRIACFILGRALERGEIAAGGLVVEASSGSTSIAMAMVCARLGLSFAAVMPAGVSSERSMIIRAYGGEVIYSDSAGGMPAALELAGQIARERGGLFTRQFENLDNVEAHRIGTAGEIAEQLVAPAGGAIGRCAVVSGIGTGGTLVGVHAGLCERGIDCIPVAALPVRHFDASAAGAGCFQEAECCSFSSRIPGVVDRLSKLYDPARLPGLMEIRVHDEEAIQTTRGLIQLGYAVGPSSGLNFAAARRAAEMLGAGVEIVTFFADRMERYFSTELFKGMG